MQGGDVRSTLVVGGKKKSSVPPKGYFFFVFQRRGKISWWRDHTIQVSRMTVSADVLQGHK